MITHQKATEALAWTVLMISPVRPGIYTGIGIPMWDEIVSGTLSFHKQTPSIVIFYIIDQRQLISIYSIIASVVILLFQQTSYQPLEN